MIAQRLLNGQTQVVPRKSADMDTRLMRRVASGDERAIEVLLDRWMPSLFKFTDDLRMDTSAGDVVVEEVFRRVMFEAPRFAARPEKFHDWLRVTIRDCASAIIAKQPHRIRTSRPAADAEGEAVAEIHSVAVDSCSALLQDARLPEALSFMNSLTPFRFTGIYRFDGMSVQNIHLFDRQTGFGSDGSVSPVSGTYCVWIQESLSVVQMKDSGSDPRAVAHPKRDIVRSYCGGPIFDPRGDLIGTICHFDYEPRETPSDVLALIEAVGPMLVNVVAPAPIS